MFGKGEVCGLNVLSFNVHNLGIATHLYCEQRLEGGIAWDQLWLKYLCVAKAGTHASLIVLGCVEASLWLSLWYPTTPVALTLHPAPQKSK